MLYERYFESKTRGIIQGHALLETDIPVSATKIYTPNPLRAESINKRELFVEDKPFDIRTNSLFVTSWKVVIRSRESKETIWVRPFAHRFEALFVYQRLLGLDMERIGDTGFYMPGTWQEGDFEYQFATVQSYTATGTTSWIAPPYVTLTDYLVVAGGGGGGSNAGGGAGAGGFLTGTNSSVTPNTSYTVTVGAGGIKSPGNLSFATSGNNSVFGSIVSTGGGYGGSYNYPAMQAAGNGGSGGGQACRYEGQTGISGSTGVAGQGYGGGIVTAIGGLVGAGGGGASGVGDSIATTGAAAGGNGLSSSISGASTYYAGGGAGGTNGTFATAALGGGGSQSDGTANTGGGGSGGANNAYPTAYNGGSGIVILSYSTVTILVGSGINVGGGIQFNL